MIKINVDLENLENLDYQSSFIFSGGWGGGHSLESNSGLSCHGQNFNYMLTLR